MLRISLVCLAAEGAEEATPLGAACVAAALEGALAGEVLVRIVELDSRSARGPSRAGARSEEVLDIAAAADAVGFSVYSWNALALADLARRLRSARPELLLFAGGPEATADPGRLVEEARLDFAVAGEGELAAVAAFRVLARAGGPHRSPLAAATAAALAEIHGLWAAREAGMADRHAGAGAPRGQAPTAPAVLFRSPRAGDAFALPSPWLSGKLSPRRGEGVLWELARGCPFRCAYCYESKGDASVRRFPMDRLLAELELFARSGVGSVFVLDPTFNADRERARGILAAIERSGCGARWKFEVRSELLDRDLARRFAAIPCSVQVGLQSASSEVLALVDRALDPGDFSRRVGYLDEAGATFGLDLIYGLPGDDLAGFRSSLDYALGLRPNHLDVFPLAVLPGTILADRAKEYGIEAQAEPPYLVRSTPRFPASELKKAAALARACDLFYTKGRAVAWFMPVLRPLKARPADFLDDFAHRAGEGALGGWARRAALGATLGAGTGAATGRSESEAAEDSLRIEAAQAAFVEALYRERGLERLAPAALDLVRFHGAWGRALAEGRTSLVEIACDPEAVAGPVGSDVRALARTATGGKAALRVGPDGRGGVRLERAEARRLRTSRGGGAGPRGPGPR